MLKTWKLVIGVALLSLAANAVAEEYDGLDAMSLAQGKLGPANAYWVDALLPKMGAGTARGVQFGYSK